MQWYGPCLLEELEAGPVEEAGAACRLGHGLQAHRVAGRSGQVV